MQVVVRILYAHMLRRKGMSSGKHSLHTRRNTVLAYLSALKSDELRVFLDFIIEVCMCGAISAVTRLLCEPLLV
jgi:hypothetical protein